MLVSIIAAMDRRGLIGDATGLPWQLPRDLRRFRAHTWGKPILMGRRTFELIGKPLPGRSNIILTHDPEYGVPGCRVAWTFQEALSLAENQLASTGGDEVMVIGGAKVYAEAIPRTDRLYLTLVEGHFTGTTYFPVRDLMRLLWRPACAPETYLADEHNKHPHSFHILERAWDAIHPSSTASAAPEEALDEMDLAAFLTGGNMEV